MKEEKIKMMNKLTIAEVKQIIVEKKNSAASDLICDQYKHDEKTKAIIRGEIMAYTDVLNLLENLERK